MTRGGDVEVLRLYPLARAYGWIPVEKYTGTSHRGPCGQGPHETRADVEERRARWLQAEALTCQPVSARVRACALTGVDTADTALTRR